VDPNPTYAKLGEFLLTDAGYEVRTVPSAEAAHCYCASRPSLFLIELGLPGLDGFALCQQLYARRPPAGARAGS
jgi:DNA-binding response OmpR family regulator